MSTGGQAAAAAATATAAQGPSDQARDHSNRRPPRRPRPPQSQPGEGSVPGQDRPGPSRSTTGGSSNKPRRHPRNPNPAHRQTGTQEGTTGVQDQTKDTSSPSRSSSHAPRRRRPAPKSQAADGASTPTAAGETDKKPKHRRGAKFGASLTETPQGGSPAQHTASEHSKPSKRYRNTAPKGDDLTSTLIHSLSTSPYPDCLICFSAIHPAQPTWSCSPLIPISSGTEDEKDGGNSSHHETPQCCWTTFHLKCIRSWASKNVKDVADAWRARGENRPGEWRCPGCQSKRLVVPSGYWCFCGAMPDPKPPRLATPHSCANPCTRTRACGHPCSLSCHPGPCPPCQVTTQLPCYCGCKTLSFRCSHLMPVRPGQHPVADLSCGQRCGKKLNCGNHECEEVCHDHDCKPCAITALAKCYCGKHEKEMKCGEGVEKVSNVKDALGLRTWTGRFACDEICDRFFDCNVHRCTKPCHPLTAEPIPCPRSPSLCHLIPNILFRPDSHLRINLTLSTLLHHVDEQAQAHARERGEPVEEILCDKPCTALRACGRHQCNRLCCPLASLASKGKGKKKQAVVGDNIDGMDDAGWHECDLVCGKMLSCGNHRCEERDHRPPCPPCLRSSFDEMICHCGRTILEPPIPCGTRIHCTYPCSRPLLPCGHPKAPHACHEDPYPCPPCPFLTSKRCACRKKMVDNVRCSQEKVSCGMTCGKLLSCGFHHCEKLCHSDGCGPCSAVCGKPRKLCLPANHPCALPCHAPAACSEAEPCRAVVNITCPCGRLRQPVPCGRSTTNPAGREGSQQLKCTNECAVAKRNARLAEALGISPETRGGTAQQVSYHEDLVSYARANAKFCAMVEKNFSDFITSDKKSHILPHMPESRRKFVHDLAAVYRMNTQMVDQEPNRSVQLIRRIDTRVPSPSLSTFIASSSTSSPHGLGKLTDLRASTASIVRPSPSHSHSSSPVPFGSGPRGWTSIVSRSQQSTPKPETPTAWLTGGGGGSRPIQRNLSPALSVPAARSSHTAPSTPAVPPPVQQPTEDVPDNWEDDV
ncbi:NFX1 family protein [Abortiporus biennis]